ncbi:MAG: hypothetical protein R2865_08460 [Deinococcales bacterium]
MTLVDIFDQQKDSLRRKNLKSLSPEALKVEVLTLVDSVYQRYQQQHSLKSEEQAVIAQLFTELKQSIGLLASWQIDLPETKAPRSRFAWLGLAEIAFGLFLFAMLWVQNRFFAAFLLLLIALIHVTRLWDKGAFKPVAKARIEIDSDKLLTGLAEVFKTFDVLMANLYGLGARDSTKTKALKPSAEGMLAPSNDNWQFFQDLLEAAYSQDGEFALKKANQMAQLLKHWEVEVIDFSPEVSRDFDLLPSLDAQLKKPQTLAPALKHHGQLLCRGKAILPS